MVATVSGVDRHNRVAATAHRGTICMKKATIKRLRTALVDQGNLRDPATGMVTLALSLSDRRHRATVQFFHGRDFQALWTTVAQALLTAPSPVWARVESLYAIQRVPRSQVEQQLKAQPRMNYWRRGISFDPDFKTALLEMEINGHEFFKPGKGHKIGKNASASFFEPSELTRYLTKRNGAPAPEVASSDTIWTFLTAGVFTDGETLVPLSTQPATRGMRTLTAPKNELYTYITAGERFLARQIKDTGQFIYGYYPARQRVLNSYNSVRHFSSIYALLEAIAFTGRTADLPAVERAIRWGLTELTSRQQGALYMTEQLKDGSREIKLGAQAMLILCLCKYQEVTGKADFLPAAREAFNGIRTFLRPDGRFNHVLNLDLSVKEAFRIIYYEGEITFAMARLYQVTPEPEIKDLIQHSLDYMVAHDYGRYRDHWISYAINEALQLFPGNRDYMRMGLKNVYGHLDFIEARDTAYPTLLELLNASVRMTTTIQATGNDDLLAPYDLARLIHDRRARAEYELTTGSFQPELAMFFYYPEKFYGGFFARHDHFRTRIDDCEHFLSGLIGYYQDTYDPEALADAH